MAPSITPEPLRLVQEFVNTLDVEDGTDELGGPRALAEWLTGRGLLAAGAAVNARQHDRALALREAVRGLLTANNGGSVDPTDLAVLNDAAAACPLEVRFAPGGARLDCVSTGVDAAIGRLLLRLFEAMSDGSWSRLKTCGLDTCRWAFYDHSKNRSGHWCSMRVCGNRTKVRQFRARRRGAASV